MSKKYANISDPVISCKRLSEAVVKVCRYPNGKKMGLWMQYITTRQHPNRVLLQTLHNTDNYVTIRAER
ncbi:hypothetical protein BBBOND_0104490 [Babesia bigemina]|uniref:Uncharacterized protein n=1 Tax=Babesia bigemina TaxID=5866 RepID=A0A061D8R8_BABBI|nr:hypothetical protein BBBOND_0104490 [Babesia bigemina]CDR94140.1 hypothetical protein BBBOND_0104490 [Babesia bigemina]|eukprot:XP_012766326.1 hypothetical protein BBBOND_0104490 [Babesia bigemina]